MRFPDPEAVAPTADERELLLSYLELQRRLVAATAAGLTEEQARWRPDGKLIAIIGIVNHLTHVEWRWIDGAYGRHRVSRSESEFTVGPERTLADVLAAYAARAAATDATVRAAPALEARCLVPGVDGVDLRWVLLHLVEETAHHAGHAESTREMLDGHTSDW